MTSHPEHEKPPGAPARPGSYSWCSWHHDLSRDTRLVRIIEAASGPGGGNFACAACRTRYNLVPVADQPVAE